MILANSSRRQVVADLASTLPTPSVQSLLAYGQADDWPEWQADQIVPGLFQGGTEDSAVITRAAAPQYERTYPYDVVVTLYGNAQPAPWGVEEVRFGFLDAALTGADATRVVRAARYAYQRWASGDRVLVRCQAGVNRSGLVTALVLVMAGLSPAQAITLIRARRSSYALCNTEFVAWLLNHSEEAVTAARATWPSVPPSSAHAA